MRNKFLLVWGVLTFFTSLFSFARVVRIPSYYSYDYSSSDTPGIPAFYYESFMHEIAEVADWEYDLIDLGNENPKDALDSGKIDLLYDMIKTNTFSSSSYYWSREASGSEYLVLVTASDNTKYNSTYIGNLNGARIGYPSGNVFARQVLEAFIQANKLSAVTVPLTSKIDSSQLLNDGTVDLLVATRFFPTREEKIIYTFGHYPVYFVSKDSSLMQELNLARSKIYESNPLYLENIFLRASGLPSVDVKNISFEEKQYILRAKSIDVIDDDFNSDGSNGEIKKEFWRYVTGVTGLAFNRVEGSGNSRTYKSPCVFDSAVTDRMRDLGLNYTQPYYNFNVRVVCAPGITIHDILRSENANYEERTLKCVIPPDVSKALPYFQDRFVPYEITERHSPAECLADLSKGKFDFALISDYSLQQRFSISDYKKLCGQEIVVFRIPISIVVKAPDASLIVSILNKAFSQLPYNYYETLQQDQGLYINRVPSQEVVRYRVVNIIFIVFGIFVVYNLIVTLWHSRRYKKQVTTDHLTGLLSITGFEENCTKMVNLLPEGKFMLTELNVRDFSFINRLYGQGSGDRILECLGRTLARLYENHKNYYICRGYADNFYVMQLLNCSVEDALKDMAENQNIIQEQLQLEEGYRIVVKCGNVIDSGAPDKPLSVKDMISKAGYARRANQDSMVENFSVFDNEIRKQRETEERIENTIEKALDDNEFFVMFQPKIDLKTEKCVGAEALVRWQTKDNGILSPDQFIPILEKNGYVTKVDFFVYKTVFEYIKKWLSEGLPVVPVSLNISRLSHDSTTFVTEFNNLFNQYEIPSNLVELEIEERFAGANDAVIKDMANDLHNSGYLVNMDDFGSGESSLNMLSEIPVDVIKFDQRFLHYAEVSESSKIILVSMVKMIKDLGKKTICEGVETEAQVEILRSVGCDTAQGYYYSRPITPEKFKDYLLKHL